MLSLPMASEERIKLEELEEPTRFNNLLSPYKDWPGLANINVYGTWFGQQPIGREGFINISTEGPC